MRIRKLGACLAATLVFAGACTASEVDPEARIDIAGTVRRQSGAAAADVRIALRREADVGQVFTVFATLGLACIDQRTNVCRGARVARAGSDGRFAFRLTGRDTQGFVGQASTMVLSSGLAAGDDEAAGPISTYRFQVQTEKLDLPVGFWEPRLEGRTGPFGARINWTAVPSTVLPPSLGGAPREHAIEFRRGDELVWRVVRARSGVAFDARVLEDTAGGASVVAALDGEPVSDQLGRKIDVVLRSGARAYQAPAGAPPSRGAACSVSGADGKLIAQSPCRLTDGEYADGFAPSVCGGASGCVEPLHRSVMIDLGARSSVALIVIRGCTGRCTVETSTDARGWRTAGVASAENTALGVTPLVAARYVRVSSTTTIDRLREVSVWGSGPQLRGGSLFISPEAVPPGPGGSPTNRAADGTDADGGGDWLRLVALGALCAAGGAFAAVWLGRRMRRAT